MVRIALVLLLTAAVATPAPAQLGGLKKLKDKAKKATDSVVDSARARPSAPPAQAAEKAAPAGAKIWENYDFVPGNKVLFFTDFTEDKVGNFARRLKYKDGPVEIVDRDGVKVLRATGRSNFLIPIGRALPERFTLEIDVIAPPSGRNEMVAFEGGPVWDRGDQSAAVTWAPHGAFILGSGLNAGTGAVKIPESVTSQLINRLVHLRVLMDGAYFKMYVNERRLYNIPELAFKRDSVIRVFLDGAEENGAVYLTSIRVAEHEVDVLYDALANQGRWSTQGILFETGKADLKPESHPVLKEIAATMKEHGDLRILIEGHTDNVGAAAANLTLSGARAAAVKNALVSSYGVDGSRMTTQGLGDTKPVLPNTTPEGRAQNRRVEIVKQ